METNLIKDSEYDWREDSEYNLGLAHQDSNLFLANCPVTYIVERESPGFEEHLSRKGVVEGEPETR